MRTESVTMVRLYLTEQDISVTELIETLQERSQLRGVTVSRGVAGYGKSGVIHSGGKLELSRDHPIVVEFFDSPEKIEQVLVDLQKLIESGHMVFWPASVCI